MSPTRLPSLASVIPAASASWQTSSRRRDSASTEPTPNVYALSAIDPSSVTPTSIVTRLPSSTTVPSGIPWTTTSSTEMQIARG